MRRFDLFHDALSNVAEPRREWPSWRAPRPGRRPGRGPCNWLMPLTLLAAGTILVAVT